MTISVDEWINVKQCLMEEFGFGEDNAESAANRLMRDPRIFRDFKEYCTKKVIPHIIEEGIRIENRVHSYTVSELVHVYGLSPVGAYLMLSEVSADKEKAEKHLQDILSNGHEIPIFDADGRLLRIEFTQVMPPLCEECGEQASWIKEYNRWYCHQCSKYLEHDSI